MRVELSASVLAVLLTGVSSEAMASPVTWQTTGVVGSIFSGGRCFGSCPTFDRPDTDAFTATFTFDPEETPRQLGADIYTYRLLGATFQWGPAFTSWFGGIGFIDTNIGNPDFGSDPHSGDFLIGVASVEAAGNAAILSLLFNDPRAVDGFLPSDPTETAALYGRLDWGGVGPNNIAQAMLFSLSRPVPVPEPGTLLLIGSGGVVTALRRWTTVGRRKSPRRI